jgi:hypothetical protein
MVESCPAFRGRVEMDAKAAACTTIGSAKTIHCIHSTHSEERNMDKAIAKHLAKRGMATAKPLRKDVTFSELNPDFFKWFHESVMGFDSEEYRREFWREARKTGHTIGHVPYGLREYRRRRDTRLEGAAILLELLIGGSALAVWLIRRMVDRHIQRLRRPTYYETERARRLGLAEERRRIRRRRTTNAMPGKKELLEAFSKAKESPSNMIRFGSLIEDLECYVDNTPYFNDGKLVGRRGGIRRHLEREIPELYARYKTVMKYKALSKKFRQATGIEDPVPAASILPDESNFGRCEGDENSVRREVLWNDGDGMERVMRGNRQKDAEKGKEKQKEQGVQKGRKKKTGMQKGKEFDWRGFEFGEKRILVEEILGACEGTVVSLTAQLEIRINPDYTPPVRIGGERLAKSGSEVSCQSKAAGQSS